MASAVSKDARHDGVFKNYFYDSCYPSYILMLKRKTHNHR
ncbi:hypothetical protein BH09BAC1_BH09BAC1_30680 [soil metagenome]